MRGIKIDTEDEFMNIRDVYYYLKHPRMADHKLIGTFMQKLLDSGIVFKERHLVETGKLFDNYEQFLAGKIYYDAMRGMRERILTNCTFFPTIAEILTFQEDFFKERTNMLSGLDKSLQGYLNDLDQETYDKLKQRMIAHDTAIGRKNNLLKG